METMTVSKNYIKRDFKNFINDINAIKNKYTIEKYTTLFIETIIEFYGIYNNKFLKTTNIEEVHKEIIKTLKEV